MTLVEVKGQSLNYRVWQIETLSDFVYFIERHCPSEKALYRGQAEDWPLKPKLARLRRRGEIPILKWESQMLEHFARAVIGHSIGNINLDDPWNVLALAQHHGMATRLLDWSYNPLAALWFALERPARKENEHSVVWQFCPSPREVLGRVTGKPQDIDHIVVWEPRHVTRRISAQAGAFTLHPDNGATVEALDEDIDFQPRLQKVLVHRDTYSDIRYYLDQCGINAATMYPDIDGLARHVEWYHSLGEDEHLI